MSETLVTNYDEIAELKGQLAELRQMLAELREEMSDNFEDTRGDSR